MPEARLQRTREAYAEPVGHIVHYAGTPLQYRVWTDEWGCLHREFDPEATLAARAALRMKFDRELAETLKLGRVWTDENGQ
jgi:plasmid stabilization system protein ParE